MRICPLEYLFTAPFSALTPLIFVTWVFKAERCFIQDKLTQKQCWTVASLNTTREVKCIFRPTANKPERKPTQCSQYCKTMDLMNLYIYLFCYFRHLQVRLQRSADALLRFLHKKHSLSVGNTSWFSPLKTSQLLVKNIPYKCWSAVLNCGRWLSSRLAINTWSSCYMTHVE